MTGGSAPLSASCTPPSGLPFTLGSTTVTCTATDAVHQTDQCSFLITVTPPSPRLGVTTILAFGDSITEGEVPVAGEFGIHPQFVEPDHSYPADLTSLLAQRYTAQGAIRHDAIAASVTGGGTDCDTDPPAPPTSGILVINAGCLGEKAADALRRLDDKITVYHPDLLLLLEGVNDLNGAASIPTAVQSVATLIHEARKRGVPVLVGTLVPQIAGDINARWAGLIAPFNAQLWPAATNAGAQVVDLYSDIATDETDWISPYDGLHPTEAGYREIARVWFASIQQAFEVPLFSTVTTNARGSGRPNTPARGTAKR
jgi:lysophospholipase L1-like esterase